MKNIVSESEYSQGVDDAQNMESHIRDFDLSVGAGNLTDANRALQMLKDAGFQLLAPTDNDPVGAKGPCPRFAQYTPPVGKVGPVVVEKVEKVVVEKVEKVEKVVEEVVVENEPIAQRRVLAIPTADLFAQVAKPTVVLTDMQKEQHKLEKKIAAIKVLQGKPTRSSAEQAKVDKLEVFISELSTLRKKDRARVQKKNKPKKRGGTDLVKLDDDSKRCQIIAELLAEEEAAKVVKKGKKGKKVTKVVQVDVSDCESSDESVDDFGAWGGVVQEQIDMATDAENHMNFPAMDDVDASWTTTLKKKKEKVGGMQYREMGAFGTVARFGDYNGHIVADNANIRGQVFVRIGECQHGLPLRIGQRVRFNLLNTSKGFEAHDCNIVW